MTLLRSELEACQSEIAKARIRKGALRFLRRKVAGAFDARANHLDHRAVKLSGHAKANARGANRYYDMAIDPSTPPVLRVLARIRSAALTDHAERFGAKSRQLESKATRAYRRASRLRNG